MIPENVQIGDVFERIGGHSHMVFIGKVTPENVRSFLDLGIMKNHYSCLTEQTIETNHLVFIIFDSTEDNLYIENCSHDFSRVRSRIVDFKYSHNQDKVEKIVNKMKDEGKKMKMEVGKVYKLREWSGVAICLEYSPDLQFKHLVSLSNVDLDVDAQDKPYMCFLYESDYKRQNVAFFDSSFASSRRIPITKQIDFDFTTMKSPWREIVLNVLNKKDEVKKCFRINISDRQVHCFEGRTKVKWAKENDKRQLLTAGGDEYFEKQWPVLNIDFPTYLLLTGLKEKSKEDELLEIKEKIFSADTLGCQKDGLKSIGEEFISLIHKIEAYNSKYKPNIVGTLVNVLRFLSPKTKETGTNQVITTQDVHSARVEGILTEYVAKLKEKN